MERVQYLGYIMDEHGLHVDLEKIQSIHNWPTPTTLTELCSFLGIAKFYHWFVLGFSNIVWSIIHMTKGGYKAKFI